MGNRWSPTVLPTVTRDPFEAGFAGLERGFGIGTEIAERQRRRQLEDRQETRSDEYLDIQRTHAAAAAQARAIEQARSGYSDVEGDPGDPDVVDVPGQYGSINYGRSAEAAQHRAQEKSFTARQDEERRRSEDMARDLEDAISRNDESYILSRSPAAYNAMRERAPIAGSEEWKAMKKFETDEAIREANRTGRYSYRSSSSTARDPRVAQLSTAIDDERARNAQYRSTVRDLRPGMVVVNPADTSGYGAAQRNQAASDSTLDALTRQRNEAIGIYDSDVAQTRPQQRGMNFQMTPQRQELDSVIKAIARKNIPQGEKQRLYDAAIARWKKMDPTAGQLIPPE